MTSNDTSVALEVNDASSSLQDNNTTPFLENDLLQSAVRDAGQCSYGTVLVSCWVLNEERTHLIRPEGGFWIDPQFHSRNHEKDGSTECKVCRLTDPNHPSYIHPEPVAPGVGLPGVLWADAQLQGKRALLAGRPPRRSFNQHDNSVIVWRDVGALARDPDQPPEPRLEAVAKYGLGWAAGVPFDNNGKKGIVVYLARDTVNLVKLRSSVNEVFIKGASDLVGSAYALREPRRAIVEQRRKEVDANFRRLRIKLLAVIAMGGSLNDLLEKQGSSTHGGSSAFSASSLVEEAKEQVTATATKTRSRLVSWWKKCRGAGNRPPPAFTYKQAMWTFVGTFSTILILTRLNVALTDQHGSDYGIVLGPFGALMTLHYGLTAAPASQPPNVLLGYAMSVSIALGLSNLTQLEVWVRQSLATAISITAMVKLGITHPPAGAAALLFADGSNGWGNMGVGMLGNAMAILTATAINNLNENKQYPTFWGLRYPLERIQELKARRKKVD